MNATHLQILNRTTCDGLRKATIRFHPKHPYRSNLNSLLKKE